VGRVLVAALPRVRSEGLAHPFGTGFAAFGPQFDANKDAEFAGRYKTVMGLGDGPLDWKFDHADAIPGILQAAGLDALGAAIRVTTPD
jgi:hypothetical protein